MKGYSEPKKIINNGYEYWEVKYPNPNGKARLRKSFKTKAEALLFCERGNIQTQNAGLQVAGLSEESKRAYIDAEKLLKPYDISVLDAIREYVDARTRLTPYKKSLDDCLKHFEKWNKVKEESTTLQRAYDLYIDDLRAKQRSTRRIDDQKSRLTRFINDMGGNQIVGLITPAMCNKWLNSLKVIEQHKAGDHETNGQALKVKTKTDVSPATRNTYRVALSGLFEFCIMAGYMKFNPIKRVATTKTELKEIEFYKIEEARNMLFSSEEKSDIRLFIAIGLFAGLRPTEIQRLNFSDICLEQKTIILPAKKTKTAKKRAVIISDTLEAWLTPYALEIRKGGKIISTNFRKRFDAFKKANNIRPIFDGLRHSYGTYFYALTSNEYETAKQMGNSPHIVKEHYANQRIIKEVAEKYFSILPNLTKITPVAEILKESATA